MTKDIYCRGISPTNTAMKQLTAKITAEMYTGGYDYDYGYITTLVYILANYSDDRVISAMAGGSPLPAKEADIHFPEYDDYGNRLGRA